MVEPVAIYRAPMRARDLDVTPGAGAEHCIGRGVVGIGPGSGEKGARLIHRFATVPEGVFVWTRDSGGGYHLGRVTGPMGEERAPSARRVGIAYTRPTRWLPRAFAQAEVPPRVAVAFARGGRNFQRIHDGQAERMTAELWSGG